MLVLVQEVEVVDRYLVYVDGRRRGVGEDRFGGRCWDGLDVKTSADGYPLVANATQGREVVMWGWSENVAKCVLRCFLSEMTLKLS